MKRILYVPVVLSVCMGCSTLSNRQKTLITMVGSGVVAGAVGAAVAPQEENPAAHAAIWAGSTAAVAGALSLFIFDEQARSKEANTRADKLERELKAFQEEAEPKLIAESGVSLQKQLPEKFKHLVIPGQWSLYKVDRWMPTSDNELTHQDYLFRFSQAQLNPAGRARTEDTNKGGKNHE